MVTCVLVLAIALSASAEEDFTESHRQTATELLILSGAKENAMVGASAMADMMLQSNPVLAPYRDVLLEWAEKVMTWDNMHPRIVEIYVDAFTEQELRELIEFYNTPIGKKTLRVLPEIMKRSALVGGELAQEHSGELQEMIQRRAAELEKYQPSQ
jgi:hypothetical protein